MQPVQLYLSPISQSKEPRVPIFIRSIKWTSGLPATYNWQKSNVFLMHARQTTYATEGQHKRTQRNVLWVEIMAGALYGQKSRLKSSGKDLGRWRVTKQAKNSGRNTHFTFVVSVSHLTFVTQNSHRSEENGSKQPDRLTNSFLANARQSCHCPVHTRPGKTDGSTTKHRQTTNSSRRADKHNLFWWFWSWSDPSNAGRHTRLETDLLISFEDLEPEYPAVSWWDCG